MEVKKGSANLSANKKGCQRQFEHFQWKLPSSQKHTHEHGSRMHCSLSVHHASIWEYEYKWEYEYSNMNISENMNISGLTNKVYWRNICKLKCYVTISVIEVCTKFCRRKHLIVLKSERSLRRGASIWNGSSWNVEDVVDEGGGECIILEETEFSKSSVRQSLERWKRQDLAADCSWG